MKRHIISSLIIISIAFSGCEDFLDKAPISNASVQNFYNTEADFQNAIYGAYRSLRTGGTYNDYVQLIGDLASDNTEMGSTASDRSVLNDMSLFRLQSHSTVVRDVWNHHYQAIWYTNVLLDRINGAAISANTKTRIGAEAKFLRGLFYFNLVRIFGDVPLVTKDLTSVEEAYSKGRSPVAEVYAHIIQDLREAAQSLPLTVPNEQGRATSGAAWALLGKVYLTHGNIADAKTALKTVIDSRVYELLPDYNDLWEVTNKHHSEAIFEVQYQASVSGGTGSSYTERYTPYMYTGLPYSSTAGGYNIPTEDLVNAYEPGDLRKDASLHTSWVNTSGEVVTGLPGRFTNKFRHMPIRGGGSSDNWPILRYADVLLLYAEALNAEGFVANGEAFTYLNTIRNRAGLPSKTAGHSDPGLRIDSQTEFALAIEQERRVELAFEGHRWYDLVRTGRAIEVLSPKMPNGVQQHQLLFPLPLTQIDLNPTKLNQNPGY